MRRNARTTPKIHTSCLFRRSFCILKSYFRVAQCIYKYIQGVPEKMCFRNFQQPNLTDCSGNHFPEAAILIYVFLETAPTGVFNRSASVIIHIEKSERLTPPKKHMTPVKKHINCTGQINRKRKS